MADITAFGTLFSAFGCRLNYNSEKVRLEVIDSPNSKITNAAIADIKHFDETANYTDGASAVIIADTIDGAKNPLSAEIRKNVLDGLSITKKGLYVYQVLSLLKNNRSWHNSDQPNSCVHFKEVCTHRGINPDPEHKGKRSNRKPDAYHVLDSHDMVKREQLVTPALRKLFQSIPQENMVSGRQSVTIHLDLKSLKKMDVEEKIRIITELQGSLA